MHGCWALAASSMARAAQQQAHAAILLNISYRGESLRARICQPRASCVLSTPPILVQRVGSRVHLGRQLCARVAHAFLAAMGRAQAWARACALLAALGAVAAQNPERASPAPLREAPGSFFRSPGVESLFNIVRRASACGARLPRRPHPQIGGPDPVPPARAPQLVERAQACFSDEGFRALQLSACASFEGA